MNYKKSFLILSITSVAIIGFILFTLHKSSNISIYNQNNASIKKTQIRFISSWAGSDTKAEKLQKFISNFQENNPNIIIINESMSGEEFLFTLKMNFAEGNDPDVFGLWPGSDIINLIEAGKVADITDELFKDKAWYDSFREETWTFDKYDDRIYGLPCEIIYEGLFINRDLFNKFKIEIPKTYEELKEAVAEFKKNGIIPIAYNSTPEGTYIYQNIVMKLAGKKGTENPLENGKLNIAFLEGMKYMKELYELGAFPDNAFTISNLSRNKLFLDKKAAMIVQGSWFIGNNGVNPYDNTVSIIPFPYFNDSPSKYNDIIYGIGNGNFHISTKAWNDSTKREACIKFLKELTSIEASNLFACDTGYISNIKIQEENASNINLIKMGYDLINNSDCLIGPTDSFIDRTIWENVLTKEFPIMLENNISPQSLYNKLQEKLVNKSN